jgi:asparagine synthase (glutamine-hydrolysing)
VQRAASTLVAVSANPIVELSGGLDSAIVLGALAGGGKAPALCVNFATAYVEGDEREHARAVAELWKAPLIELAAAEEEMAFERLERLAQPVEPMLYGLDFILETALVSVAHSVDADAIVTGQGGDAVFFQQPTADVVTDYLRDRGLRAFFSDVAFDATRRAHGSIWRTWRNMAADRLGVAGSAGAGFDRSLLGPSAAGAVPALPCHPWLANAASLPPAKRLQLEALSNCQIFNGPTHRAAAAQLIHPLLSQPVMERCLSIPTWQLAGGRGDRALARAAFRDLLPDSIHRRRGKGEASSYYGRAVGRNLPFLRSYLLDGALVANGLLSADALDALLDEQALMWSDRARLPVLYASFEAWARHWGL